MSRVGGRRSTLDVQLTFSEEGGMTVYLSKLPFKRIAGEFARVIREEAAANTWRTRGPVAIIVGALRAFCGHLEEIGFPRNAGCARLRPEHLESFEAACRAAANRSDGYAHRLLGPLRRALQMAADRGLTHPDLAPTRPDA